MTFGIDIKSAVGSKAGIGFYTKSLVQALGEIDKENSYILYSTEEVDWGLDSNFRVVVYKYESLLDKFIWHLQVWFDLQIRGAVDAFLSPHSLTLPMLSIFRKNVVLTVMDLVPLRMSETSSRKVRLLFKQFPFAIRRSAALLAISEATKNDLIDYINIDPAKVTVTPLAAHEWCFGKVSKKEIEEVKKKYNLPEKYFLFVSTLEPRKNIPNLIRAFAKFSKDDKQGFKLVIGGKKGWLYDDIFEVVKEEGVEDKVIFTDYIPDEDMLTMYKGATAFTFVPFMEGFGLTPLEAMATGIPVLTSDCSSLPEVAGDAALLADPNYVEDIADNMRKLAGDERLRKTLVQRGNEQVKKFSWNKTARKTLEVFEKVASR